MGRRTWTNVLWHSPQSDIGASNFAAQCKRDGDSKSKYTIVYKHRWCFKHMINTGSFSNKKYLEAKVVLHTNGKSGLYLKHMKIKGGTCTSNIEQIVAQAVHQTHGKHRCCFQQKLYESWVVLQTHEKCRWFFKLNIIMWK